MAWVKKVAAAEGYVVVAYDDEIEQKFIMSDELAGTAEKASRSDFDNWDVINDMEPNIAVVKESDMAAIEEAYEKVKSLINKLDVQPAE